MNWRFNEPKCAQSKQESSMENPIRKALENLLAANDRVTKARASVNSNLLNSAIAAQEIAENEARSVLRFTTNVDVDKPDAWDGAADSKCTFPNCQCIEAPPCPHYAHTLAALPLATPPSDERAKVIDECIELAKTCNLKFYPNNSSGNLAHQIDQCRADFIAALRALSSTDAPSKTELRQARENLLASEGVKLSEYD